MDLRSVFPISGLSVDSHARVRVTLRRQIGRRLARMAQDSSLPQVPVVAVPFFCMVATGLFDNDGVWGSECDVYALLFL
jgi:hypothetical protein